jgi:hypothetical protein
MPTGILSYAACRFLRLFQITRADAHLRARVSETSGEPAAFGSGATHHGDDCLH